MLATGLRCKEKKVNSHMNIQVRPYEKADIAEAISVWNEVVKDGVAFPQEEPLTFLRTILKAEPCENS